MTEELLQLRLVTSRLQLIQDLCKAIVAHLGEGLRRQLTVWSRAASLRQRSSSGLAALDTAVVTNVRVEPDCDKGSDSAVALLEWPVLRESTA